MRNVGRIEDLCVVSASASDSSSLENHFSKTTSHFLKVTGPSKHAPANTTLQGLRYASACYKYWSKFSRYCKDFLKGTIFEGIIWEALFWLFG
jgi:hypothetical protein